MTLDQLDMFSAVVNCGTFSAAAKKLHISQPSISVAIKHLESELNLVLFDRSSYRPRLTSEGQEVYRQAQYILGMQKNLKASAVLMSTGQEPQISIILDIVAPLPQILGLIRAYFSSEQACKIELSFCVLGAGLRKVINNEADLYIGPIFEEIEHLKSCFYTNYFMVPVLLKKYVNNFSSEEINAVLQKMPRVILRQTKERDINEGYNIYVEDYLIKKETILAGLGWGRLPLWNIEHELNENILLDLRDYFPAMKIQGDIFVVPKNCSAGKHLSAILALLNYK